MRCGFFPFLMRQKRLAELLLPTLLSSLSVSLSQFALLLVPLCFPFLSLLFMLAISGALLLAGAVLSRFCRRLLRISASPFLFLLFTVLFVWGVYIGVIREALLDSDRFSSVKNVIINTEFALLVVGLYRIYHSDPGIVKTHLSPLNRMDAGTHSEMDGLPQQQSPDEERVRYCKICKAYIKGFDHHCPAFDNCIGQSNHLLFVVLLIGFITVELSYVACASQFTEIQQNTHTMGLQIHFHEFYMFSWFPSLNLQESISNILPVVFLLWHFYCICVNIKTDEWIKWKKYPEFQVVVPQQSGHPFAEVGFRNPYNRGIFSNIQEFLGFV
ncbi:hypothetical protein H6P81_016091 [Aristolochia fimbriata]|uniref:S-acyltransferase n=1 Tax=Aristolochia fimbriata TaxID=158543 RepID=A0AAV7EAE0_ARIFI|nr:hypothetical protein H6P81_016091 [Aristolochia fimbriata]